MATRFVVYQDGVPISGREWTTWGDAFQEVVRYDGGQRKVVGDANSEWGPDGWAFTGSYRISRENR